MRIDQTLSELPCLRKSGHRVHRSNPDPPICRLLVSSIHLSLSCCAAFAAGKKLCCPFVRCFLDRRRHFCSDYQNNNLRSSAQPPSVSLADGE
jgi:hypothetical protein